MGDFKAVLGLVFAACVAIVFIGASVLGGGSSPPAVVSWVTEQSLSGGTVTGKYFMGGVTGDGDLIADGCSGYLSTSNMQLETDSITITDPNYIVIDTRGSTKGTCDISTTTIEDFATFKMNILVDAVPGLTIVYPVWWE